MKLAYKTWNKEHYVSDDIVKEDLVSLSDGLLELHEGHNSLDTLSMHAHKQAKERPSTQQRTKTPSTKRSGTGSISKNKRSSPTGKASGGSGNYKRKR